MSSTPAPVTLKPDVRLPLLVVALGLALLPLPLSPWPTLVVVLFGLFLLIQSASLRLEFKEDALIVAAAFPLRPMAELAALRPLVARPVLFPRNPEHSLPADPVQPQGAAGTAGTAGRSPGSTERRHGRQHEQ